jgi:hypothetical protein
MCQYHPRCDVIQHRPTTVCPYAGSRGPTPLHAPATPRFVTASANRSDRSRYTAPSIGSGVSLADFLLWWAFLAFVWDGEAAGGVLIALAIVVVLPLAIGTKFSTRCSAWNSSDATRCSNRRRGVFCRCQHHTTQFVTLYDVAALFCWLTAAAAFVLFMAH